MALETAIDITLGHKDTLELVDESLRAFAEAGEGVVSFPASLGARLQTGDKRKTPRPRAGTTRRRSLP